MSAANPMGKVIRRAAVLFFSLVLFGLGSPLGAEAAKGSVALLNAQRSANGIPTLADEPSLAAWCPDESAGFGVVSGVGDSESWSLTQTPFTGAPLHESLIYSPSFSAAGTTDVGGASCVGLGIASGDLPRSFSAPTFYQYVGPMGANTVSPSETVHPEEPYNPLQIVGLGPGRTVGPIMYAYGWVPGAGDGYTPATPVSVSLTEQGGGEVRVAMISQATIDGSGREHTTLPGVTIVPPDPLNPSTTYQAEVVWQGAGGQTATQSFAFTTTAGQPALSLGRADPKLRVRVHANRNGKLTGMIRFSRGDRGILRVGIQCRGAAHAVRLHVYGRRTSEGSAKLRGRIPVGCSGATVVAVIGEAPGFRSAKAKPRRLRVH